MAAISMNDSLRSLAGQALLISSLFSDESEFQRLKGDMEADYISVRSLLLLKKALVLMDKEGTLHSYIADCTIIFPLLKPVKLLVSRCTLCRHMFPLDCILGSHSFKVLKAHLAA